MPSPRQVSGKENNTELTTAAQTNTLFGLWNEFLLGRTRGSPLKVERNLLLKWISQNFQWSFHAPTLKSRYIGSIYFFSFFFLKYTQPESHTHAHKTRTLLIVQTHNAQGGPACATAHHSTRSVESWDLVGQGMGLYASKASKPQNAMPCSRKFLNH